MNNDVPTESVRLSQTTDLRFMRDAMKIQLIQIPNQLLSHPNQLVQTDSWWLDWSTIKSVVVLSHIRSGIVRKHQGSTRPIWHLAAKIP